MKKNINVERSVKELRVVTDELSKLTLCDSDIADRKMKQFWLYIYPVLKAFIQTSLRNDDAVAALLLEAIEQENDLMCKCENVKIQGIC